MPSWNIHSALTKQMLADHDPSVLGITDTNQFAYGSLVPDVYVGYMVKDISHTHRYIETHLTSPEHIPVPGADIFWERYIAPYLKKGGVESLVLGAWAHLETDASFNRAVRAFNAAHHVEPGNETRIRKQADFHLFGNSLDMDLRIVPDASLLAAAARFPQYPLLEDDVKASLVAFEEVKRKSKTEPMTDTYMLVSREFMEETLKSAQENVVAGLSRYAQTLAQTGFPAGSPQQLAALLKNADDAQAAAKKRPALTVGPAPAILFKDNKECASIEYEIARMKDKSLPDPFAPSTKPSPQAP